MTIYKRWIPEVGRRGQLPESEVEPTIILFRLASTKASDNIVPIVQMLSAGVTEFIVTENIIPPLDNDIAWQTTPPTHYTLV